MILIHGHKGRAFHLTPVKRILTTRMECASLRGIDRTGDIALHRKRVTAHMRIGLGDCHQECLCVGMAWGDTKLLRRCQLKDPP